MKTSSDGSDVFNFDDGGDYNDENTVAGKDEYIVRGGGLINGAAHLNFNAGGGYIIDSLDKHPGGGNSTETCVVIIKHRGMDLVSVNLVTD